MWSAMSSAWSSTIRDGMHHEEALLHVPVHLLRRAVLVPVLLWPPVVGCAEDGQHLHAAGNPLPRSLPYRAALGDDAWRLPSGVEVRRALPPPPGGSTPTPQG